MRMKTQILKRFTAQKDTMRWNCTNQGTYTTGSVYRIMMGIGQVEDKMHRLWKLGVPATVRIFLFLLFKEKLLTYDVMSIRNMGAQAGCQMCMQCPIESVLHLIFLCPNATEVWYEMSVRLGYRIMVPQVTMVDIWETSKSQVNRRGGRIGKEWGVFFACTCWHIWKQ